MNSKREKGGSALVVLRQIVEIVLVQIKNKQESVKSKGRPLGGAHLEACPQNTQQKFPLRFHLPQ